VIALVDGERVTVRSKADERLRYELNYLDIVVIPASVGPYVIQNDTTNPVVVYKVQVKE
jgi:mannose-6-phosphate isomerase